MKILTEKELKGLIKRHDDYCVTIYMSAGSGSQKSLQYPLKLRGLLKEAQERLVLLDVSFKDVKAIIDKARSLINDTAFWLNQDKSLCLYITRSEILAYKIPADLKDSVAVSHYFNIFPVLEFVLSNKEFYVLALNYSDTRLYIGDNYSLKDITPKAMKVTLEEVLSRYENVEEKFFHVKKEGKDKGIEGVIFHGRGGLKENQKIRDEIFLREIEGCADKFLGNDLPLVLVGIEYPSAAYRKISNYRYLLDEGVLINPISLPVRKIHNYTVEIVKKYNENLLKNIVQRYFSLKNEGLASSEAGELLRMAVRKNVDILYINRQREIKESFSEKDDIVTIDGLTRVNSASFLNYLSINILESNGRIIFLDNDKMPEKSLVAATFRY